MKQKLLAMCCTLVLVVGLFSISAVESQASENSDSEALIMIDGSYLTHDQESIGYATLKTRGVYLLAGYSKCVVAGEKKIYAGGTTIATQTVNEVGVGVMIERAKEDDDHWECIESWSKSKENADRVSSTKYLDVESGYYYRARCIHSAGGDGSDSFTDGVYVE